MKVILTKKVATLGNVGEVVAVSPGYARNFLIPKGKAVVVGEGKLRQLEAHKRALGKKIEEEKQNALAIKEKLEGMVLTLHKKVGANGKLFGAVTTGDLAKELEASGIEVERRTLTLAIPIKKVGIFDVRAKLFSGVESNFQVKVEVDPAQAEELKKQQEMMEKKAKEKKTKAQDKPESSKPEERSESPLSEEQKLQKEVDGILRN